jgi:hypothetical protein
MVVRRFLKSRAAYSRHAKVGSLPDEKGDFTRLFGRAR